jgi:hypothetical protein
VLVVARRWEHGDLIVRREVLGLAPRGPSLPPSVEWIGKPWMAVPVYVVDDTDDALVTFIAPGAEFGFPNGAWPTRDGRHPWSGRRGWSGHGALMVQKPGEHHAVWHFWTGPERTFACWYINLQTAFVRTASGYDTQDLELDIVVLPDGTWTLKDRELLDDRVAEGRFSPQLAHWIVSLADQLTAELDARCHWWDHHWANWKPSDEWHTPLLPSGWRGTSP